jgi:ferrous iron transport protein A
MPITMANIGETVTIRKITGRDEVRQHLAELGFVVDGAVTIVSKIAGNLILQVKDSRIALDESMTNRILVLCQELAQIKMRFSDAQLAIFCSLVILR